MDAPFPRATAQFLAGAIKAVDHQADGVAVVEQIRRGMLLANQAVISDIEIGCTYLQLPDSPHRWYDTQDLLNPHELSPRVIDMNAMALQYADEANLIERHSTRPHLVRILPGHD